jgi:hypothetical protein
MIELTDAARAVLRGPSIVRVYSIESWRDGELLADNIPAVSPNEEGDTTLRVPERLTFSVPRKDQTGYDWTPVGEDHPLAAYGQRLRVELGIGLRGTEYEWVQRGWFVIVKSKPAGQVINVEARGLTHLIDEARLVSPFQPSGTIVSTLRKLMEPAVTLDVDASLTPDRSVPADINYDEDRLGAVLEIMDAWPARYRTSPEGYVEVLAPELVTTPTFELSWLKGGTLLEASGDSTRDDAYNVVVARGTAADGTQLQGVAYDETGPARYNGPFNPLPVPYFFYSPLLTTQAQCDKAAFSVLLRKQRETSQAYDVTIVPDPSIELGDVGTVYTEQRPEGFLAVVETLSLPYAADGGTEQLRVREV